jgi:3-phosphoshikimate 1-carboxyvinyltransferase
MRKLESSQFISALLMILPKVKGNPSLWIDKNMKSFSYVELSLHLMEELGFRFDFTGDRIRFVEREKTVDQIDVEPDMSSAFYWLAYAFCSESADIMLEGLGSESTQYEMKFLQNLQIEGVSWAFEKEGLRLRRKRNEARNLQRNMDFRNVPDLVPTFAMMLPFLPRGIYQWIGLEFLNSKESRREDHLSEYLRSLNIFMRKEYAHWIIDTSACEPATEYTFEVHSDHRLAMSLISLAFCSELKIHTPEVVGKSYPGFWKDLKLANFVIEDIEQQRT